MPTLFIRPAMPADIPLVRALIRELAEFEKSPDSAKATDALLHDAHFGPRPIVESLIGEIDGRPQGFAIFYHNYSSWTGRRGLYLEDLFVRPASRGLGLGKALFLGVAKLAHARGCARMEWAVIDWNAPAIEFYKSLTATPMDEWTTFRLTDDKLALLVKP